MKILSNSTVWDKFQLSVSDRQIYGNDFESQVIVREILKSMANVPFDAITQKEGGKNSYSSICRKNFVKIDDFICMVDIHDIWGERGRVVSPIPPYLGPKLGDASPEVEKYSLAREHPKFWVSSPSYPPAGKIFFSPPSGKTLFVPLLLPL